MRTGFHVTLALTLLGAVVAFGPLPPASAQQATTPTTQGQGAAGAMRGAPAQSGMPGPGMMGGRATQGGPHAAGRWGHYNRPLISEILAAGDQLGLSVTQTERLRSLRSNFEKQAIQSRAQIR